MSEIKIKEQTKPTSKKLVALEMSTAMWKSLRYEAVDNGTSFSALVRSILNQHLVNKGKDTFDE